MILVFGGTTEGRKAVKVLEEAGTAYYYSTKTGEQDITLHHGSRIDGALDEQAMQAFCHEHGIRLLVDAAHPFATVLHQTIIVVAAALGLPVIRFERIYPPRDPDIVWLDSYAELIDRHAPCLTSLLATTGVQTISRLRPLEALGVRVIYRILPRESSLELARRQGAADHQLCFYEDGEDERKLLEQLRPDAILLKESGLTGGFVEKVTAARELGIRIYAMKRPLTDSSKVSHFVTVDGPHGLRRMIERLLPEFFSLHSGLTTGTCATAAAVAATMQLLKDSALMAETDTGTGFTLPPEVPVVLPNGETIHVPVVYGAKNTADAKELGEESHPAGMASVWKESGDDPDVTNGLEIRVHARLADRFEIAGGEGIGTITLPGFDAPPGSPAINKAPQEMIMNNVQLTIGRLWPTDRPTGDGTTSRGVRITISVPQGAEIARRTFNPRLGITGGISIIGVSGIIKPFSEEAFIDSIRKCMVVAKASGTSRVVINSGGKSERFIKPLYPDLPQQAFVEYGNYVGETLKIAHELGIRHVTLGMMLGKAVKLAAGHLDTHSRRAVMDKAFIARMLREAGCTSEIIGNLQSPDFTLARELWHLIPPAQLGGFTRVVITRCMEHCRPLLPDGTLTILLMDDEGNLHTL